MVLCCREEATGDQEAQEAASSGCGGADGPRRRFPEVQTGRTPRVQTRQREEAPGCLRANNQFFSGENIQRDDLNRSAFRSYFISL